MTRMRCALGLEVASSSQWWPWFTEVRGYVGVVQTNQTDSLEGILPAKKRGRGRDVVPGHVQRVRPININKW